MHIPRANARARRAAVASRRLRRRMPSFMARQRVTRSRPLQLRTAVEFTLGDDVRYSGFNLDTTVTRRAAHNDGAERIRERDGHVTARRHLRRVRPKARARARATLVQRPARRSGPRRARHPPARDDRLPQQRDRGRHRAHGHAEGAAHARVLDACHERGRRAVVSAVRPAGEREQRRHGHRRDLGVANRRALVGAAASAPRRAAVRQHARLGRAHGAVDGNRTPAR